MAEEKRIPLSIAMENAKGKIIQTVNQVSAEMKLPAYLLEGAILDVLSEIRGRKNLELLNDINAMNAPAQEETPKQEE